MATEIWIALLSLIGTLIGSLSGVVVSARLTNYRIEQLEKKVDKHNGFAEKIPVIQEDIKDLERRIAHLEK